ncbi:hypothetical protein L9F63_023438 [Diploptera punctata]|uniref:Mutator-like transposase domain-containing protein n=1 Tax=Diploptera punctata TaxID=6984 RepID=A0AAD8E921_DIPPU|nr:hypothetical protein L9F63_023438 [Diploptera punctata]
MKLEDYSLVHTSVWGQLYRGIKCNICGTEALNTEMNERSVFAYNIIIKCTSCNNLLNEIYSNLRINTDESNRPPFDVNRRMVGAFLSLGKGNSAIEQFYMTMVIEGSSTTTYNSHLLKLHEESNHFKQRILDEARIAVR